MTRIGGYKEKGVVRRQVIMHEYCITVLTEEGTYLIRHKESVNGRRGVMDELRKEGELVISICEVRSYPRIYRMPQDAFVECCEKFRDEGLTDFKWVE